MRRRARLPRVARAARHLRCTSAPYEHYCQSIRRPALRLLACPHGPAGSRNHVWYTRDIPGVTDPWVATEIVLEPAPLPSSTNGSSRLIGFAMHRRPAPSGSAGPGRPCRNNATLCGGADATCSTRSSWLTLAEPVAVSNAPDAAECKQ